MRLDYISLGLRFIFCIQRWTVFWLRLVILPLTINLKNIVFLPTIACYLSTGRDIISTKIMAIVQASPPTTDRRDWPCSCILIELVTWCIDNTITLIMRTSVEFEASYQIRPLFPRGVLIRRHETLDDKSEISEMALKHGNWWKHTYGAMAQTADAWSTSAASNADRQRLSKQH